MSKVYMTQFMGERRDYSSAKKFGELVFLTDSLDKPSLNPGPTLHKIRRKLANFNPSEDYIAYAGGDPYGLMLVGVVLRELGFKEINFLRWEREITVDGIRTGNGYYAKNTVSIIKEN